MERKIVHVIGTGTIGEPLIGLLCDYEDQLGIDEITFHKNSALKNDRSKVYDLLKRGARLAVDKGKEHEFKKLGMDPDFEAEESIKRASVVIDCTPRGIGQSNKLNYYENMCVSVGLMISVRKMASFHRHKLVHIIIKTMGLTMQQMRLAFFQHWGWILTCFLLP